MALTLQATGPPGVFGNPRAYTQFEWNPCDFQVQAVYQAFLARKAAFELGRMVIPQIGGLAQIAGMHQDHLLAIEGVVHQHTEAFQYVWGQLENFLSETAGMSQALVPLNAFAEQVRTILGQFYSESSRLAEFVACLEQELAQSSSALATFQAEVGQKEADLDRRVSHLEGLTLK